jgi:heat shock protein HtpX
MFRGGFRSSSGSSDRGKGGAGIAILIAVVLIAVAWALSIVIRFALSRSREYLADAGSVELTKDPDAMISALRKIENRGELAGSTSAVMEMCVDNPRQGFADLFATHPPIESRVDALVRYAGGHDPGPLSLPEPDDMQEQGEPSPWGSPEAGPSPDRPFLPPEPPVSIGGDTSPRSSPGPGAGPWGPAQPPGPPSGPWGPRRDG